MAKYKVTKNEDFEIVVEAKDEVEAYDIAHNQEKDEEWQNTNSETTGIRKVGV